MNETINYNEFNKIIGNNGFFKILGYFFLVAGILCSLGIVFPFINWKLRESDYNREYIYSNYGLLYYEKNKENINIEKIYNTDGEVIELNIPDKNTAIMYCDKNQLNECIYFDQNNKVDMNMLNPIMGILITLFFFAGAFFFLSKKRVNKLVKKDNSGNEVIMEKSSLTSIYLLFVWFFVVGIVVVGWQLFNAINYFNLKKDNNIATATIYSEIYSIRAPLYHGTTKIEQYIPVSYYYVNNQKYIYINDEYESGTLNNNLGKTFELYYDKNNPNIVSEKTNPINILLLIIGICFIVFSFPLVFFSKKQEKRIDKTLSN